MSKGWLSAIVFLGNIGNYHTCRVAVLVVSLSLKRFSSWVVILLHPFLGGLGNFSAGHRPQV